VEKVARAMWEADRQEELLENGCDIGPWFSPSDDLDSIADGEEEAHVLRFHRIQSASLAISIAFGEAARMADHHKAVAEKFANRAWDEAEDQAFTAFDARASEAFKIAAALRAIAQEGKDE
jgi:hypothetical protein